MSHSSLPPTAAATETAAAAGDAVYRLRDQAHGLATPQVIHTVLVMLADVPGRLANIYDTLAARLDTLAQDDQLTHDDGDSAAAWFDVGEARDQLDQAARALEQARSHTTRPCELVSRLTLTPQAHAARQETSDPDDGEVEG